MITSSMRNAADQFTYALEAGGGFFHVVSDSFTQTFSLIERAFFRRDTDSPNYIPSLEHCKELKPADTTANDNSRVFYAAPSMENNTFPPELIRAMISFMEHRNLRSLRMPQNNLPILVLYGKEISLPPVLESQIVRITFPPLSHEDFSQLLSSELHGISRAVIREYETLAGGFEEHELIRLFAAAKSRGFALNEMDNIRSLISEHKKHKLAVHGKLSCEDASSVQKTAGMKNAAAYLAKEKRNIDAGFKSRGMLFVGLPGSGKSAMAKFSAQLLGLPLIRMDMSRILGSYVGESEQNMREALSDLQAVSPCVFWIDEIDKAMAGSKGEDNTGVVIRLMGMLLTFMQESDKCVFTVATANSINSLPPELFRNMRIDARFAAVLPDYKACREILSLHMNIQPEGDGLLEELLEIITNMTPDAEGKFTPHFLSGADIAAIAEEFGKLRKLHPEDNPPDLMRSVCRYVLPTASSESWSLNSIAQSYCAIMGLSVMMADGSEMLENSPDDEPLFTPERYHPERLPDNDCMIPPEGSRIILDDDELSRLAREIVSERNKRKRFGKVRRMFDSIMFRSITQRMNRLLRS